MYKLMTDIVAIAHYSQVKTKKQWSLDAICFSEEKWGLLLQVLNVCPSTKSVFPRNDGSQLKKFVIYHLKQ